MFLGKFLSKHTPSDKKHPHIWMVSGCFTDSMAALTIASWDNHFLIRDKISIPVLCSQITLLPAECQSILDFFLERDDLFVIFLDTKPSCTQTLYNSWARKESFLEDASDFTWRSHAPRCLFYFSWTSLKFYELVEQGPTLQIRFLNLWNLLNTIQYDYMCFCEGNHL